MFFLIFPLSLCLILVCNKASLHLIWFPLKLLKLQTAEVSHRSFTHQQSSSQVDARLDGDVVRGLQEGPLQD